MRTRPGAALLDPAILRTATGQAFVKLAPRVMVRIPVMFLVEVGAVITTAEFCAGPGVFVGDRSAVTGGTRVLSDQVTIEVTSRPGDTFLDRMIALVEGASRQKTPNEVALDILISGMTLILLVAVVTLQPMAVYDKAIQSTAVLVALFACLAPTTIGGLLSAIGIAGMDRMVQRNVLAMSGRAVEAAGDCSTLLLDKTGTITYGNRMAAALVPVRGVTERELAEAALLSSTADETPEGRSIVDFAQERLPVITPDLTTAELIAFTAQTRMSGIDLPAAGGHPARSIRKGAADSVRGWVTGSGDIIPADLTTIVEQIATGGGTPLLVADGPRVLGVIHLKDTVKQGMPERFARLRDMGIRTVMITGDNPLTAKAIAAEAGVDDFLAEATPEEKLALIRREQRGGHMVAMTGDGTNDAPALAQADVGLAMNTGTQAAKEAGNMVDLDSNPTKLIEVVEVAKQLLITRGSLTTFSIANDVAKYFAIIPAMFVVAYPRLRVLNVMHLHSPHTAILAAVSTSPGGNMEGKEARFGPSGSALMTVGTTAGATDSALDSYTPVGGAAAFVAILLGEVSPGGDGGGLYGILILALLSVFIAGLMVGRTPEFLGKKIRAPQMKLVVTYVLTIPVVVLVLGSISLVIGPGTSSILNPGLHGLTEVTYAYASAAQNNGSAFAGLAANTPWYDITLGLTMLIGRFAPIILALAIAGSLAGARVHARTRATMDTAGLTFAGFLTGVIVIVGGLIYFPMLILGPIGERIVG